MIPDKIRASLPMTKAFKEIKARNPIARGKRVAAFSLNKRRSGSKNFLPFFPLPRAVKQKKIDTC